MGSADVAGIGLGSDGGARVHGISGGGVYLAGSSGVDGLFGGAAEVICGDPHHTHAGRVADFDRGAGEEPAPGVNLRLALKPTPEELTAENTEDTEGE